MFDTKFESVHNESRLKEKSMSRLGFLSSKVRIVNQDSHLFILFFAMTSALKSISPFFKKNHSSACRMHLINYFHLPGLCDLLGQKWCTLDKRPFVWVFLLSLQCHQQTDRLVRSVCARDEWVGSNTVYFQDKRRTGKWRDRQRNVEFEFKTKVHITK